MSRARSSLVVFVGIDDTDTLATPGTNQLARAMLRRLGEAAGGAVICRHQLFLDPLVPFTSKNGSASIQLPQADPAQLERLIDVLREVIRSWFVVGSDPGLCVSAAVSDEVLAFGLRCKSQIVTQDEARAIAARVGCHLEGLGGTEQGVIGALAAVGLAAGGEDGRVVHLASWPYQDEFCGFHEVAEIRGRGVDEVRLIGSEEPIVNGVVDIGKRLRPNWRNRRIVLYVEAASGATPWRAVKLP